MCFFAALCASTGCVPREHAREYGRGRCDVMRDVELARAWCGAVCSNAVEPGIGGRALQ